MATIAGIWNLALSHLGDEATISGVSPPEGSAQAEHCDMWYPLARDQLLERHDWRFATRRKALTRLDVPSWNWQFAYGLPNNLLTVRSVMAPGAASWGDSEEFELESLDSGAGVLFTNIESATMRGIYRVEDPTVFSALFTDSLAWLLASYLAGPILKGDSGAKAAQQCYGVFLRQFETAAAHDANQRNVGFRDEPSSFIKCR